MRQGQNNKRARGRGRKPQSAANRTYDSNGPDVKIRGTASQIAEKYVALSRDAQVSGDPVASENYLQHAEHYLRIIAHAQAQHQIQNQSQNQNIAPVPGSGAQPSVVNGEDAAEGARETRQETRKGAADGASGGSADPPSHGAANGEADGRSRRPGGRRGRPRAVADAGAPAAEAAPATDAADVGSPSPRSGGDDPVVAEAG